ncbi:MAG TPA: extracellular solute-binding protein, partial [Limnochordia bacterium]
MPRSMLALSLAVLLACSAATAVAAPAQITLQWGVGQGGAFMELYQRIADAFEAAHPNVTIQITQSGYDQLREKVVVGHAAGTPIDIFEAHSQFLAELAEEGIIADLGPYLAADRSLDLSQYIP